MRVVALDEIVDPVETWNPLSRATDTFDYVDISAVSQTEKRILSSNLLRGDEAPSRARQIIRYGDILVSTVRPNLNGVAPVTSDFDGATASTGFCVLRPSKAKIASSYLMHWVQSPKFVAQMVRQATGASYPAVSDKIIKNSKIPLPSLDEQRRIAAILDKADALRHKRKRALDLLDGLMQSLFSTMFGDADQNHKRLPVVALGEVIADGPSNGLYKPASAYGRGTPILRINNFYAGEVVDLRDLRRLDIERDEMFRFELRTDDIVINRVNSREYVGKSALIPSLSEATVYESNIMRFRVRLDMALPRFIIQSLQSDAIRRQIVSKAKDAINQSSINQKDVISLQIVLPSIKEQKQFVKVAGHILALRATQRSEDINGQALFASLQHRAFSGQL